MIRDCAKYFPQQILAIADNPALWCASAFQCVPESAGEERAMGRRLLRLPGVKAATGLSKADIYREQREGRFPHSIPLGRRSVAWIEDEVVQWIENKIAAQRPNRSEKAAPHTTLPPPPVE